LTPDLVPQCSSDEHCITCGDEAKPMRVVRVDSARELALCEADDGARRTVEIGLVAPVGAGDRVLVHADVALTSLGAAA
jgi:hydrogenase maturation factor